MAYDWWKEVTYTRFDLAYWFTATVVLAGYGGYIIGHALGRISGYFQRLDEEEEEQNNRD